MKMLKGLTDRGQKVVLLKRCPDFVFNGAQAIKLYLKKSGISSVVIETARPKRSYSEKVLGSHNTIDINLLTAINEHHPKILGVSMGSHDIPAFLRLLGGLAESKPDAFRDMVFVFGGAGVITDPWYVHRAFSFLKNSIIVATSGEEIMRRISVIGGMDKIIANSGFFPRTLIRQGDTVIDNLSMDDSSIITKRLSPATAQRMLAEENAKAMLMGKGGGVVPEGPEFKPAIPYYFDVQCRARCKFCSMSNEAYARLAGLRSVRPDEREETVDEAVRFVEAASAKMKNGRILFEGDDMFADPELLESFVDRLGTMKERLREWDFVAWARPVSVLNHGSEELLGKMKDCGFAMIVLGVETFSPAFLKSMGKASTVEKNMGAILKLKKAGINVSMTQVTFYPSATMDTVRGDLKSTIEVHEKYGLFLAFHPIMLATHVTPLSVEYADCIEYEEVSTPSGTVKVPRFVRPRNQMVRGLQDKMMERYAVIRDALLSAIPDVVITRTLEALIYSLILSQEMNDKELARRYRDALSRYAELYPVEHRGTLLSIAASG